MRRTSPRIEGRLTGSPENAARRILHWYRARAPLYHYIHRGPAYHTRDLATNAQDFFSTDAIADISGAYFFSYADTDKHIYAFDVRSIHMLIQRARNEGSTPENPYNRAPLSVAIMRKVRRIIRWLESHHMQSEWAPLTPPTPEQQWRMKVVDLFTRINELNYYSSPNWFIDLDIAGQRRFYNELYDIWNHRAGLSLHQKHMIVPGFAVKLFRQAPWTLLQVGLESLQKLNLSVIRLLISSAEDRNDQILGAMYVVSALTLVNSEARLAYPWLFESVGGVAHEPPPSLPAARRGFLLGILGDLFAFPPLPPPLALEPPMQEHME